MLRPCCARPIRARNAPHSRPRIPGFGTERTSGIEPAGREYTAHDRPLAPPPFDDEIPVSKARILVEFWQFLKVRKKFWLAPIVIVLVLLSLLIVATQGSALAPFIYALF